MDRCVCPSGVCALVRCAWLAWEAEREGQCPAVLCTVTRLAKRGSSIQRDFAVFALHLCVL